MNLTSLKLTSLKLAGQGERISRSVRTYCSRLIRRWLKLLEALDGQECYMRWPGERMLPPRQQPGPGWDVRSEWELAA